MATDLTSPAWGLPMEPGQWQTAVPWMREQTAAVVEAVRSGQHSGPGWLKGLFHYTVAPTLSGLYFKVTNVATGDFLLLPPAGYPAHFSSPWGDPGSVPSPYAGSFVVHAAEFYSDADPL